MQHSLTNDWDCWLLLALPRLAFPLLAPRCRGSVASSSSSSAPFGAPAVPELETLLLAYLDDAGVDGQIKDSMDWLTELGKPEQHEVTHTDRRPTVGIASRALPSSALRSRWCR